MPKLAPASAEVISTRKRPEWVDKVARRVEEEPRRWAMLSGRELESRLGRRHLPTPRRAVHPWDPRRVPSRHQLALSSSPGQFIVEKAPRAVREEQKVAGHV